MSPRERSPDTELVVGLVICKLEQLARCQQDARAFHAQDSYSPDGGRTTFRSGMCGIKAEDMLPARYSATGAEPATHAGCASLYAAEQWARIVGYKEAHATPMTCALIASHAAFLESFERQQMLGSRHAQRDAIAAFEKQFVGSMLLRRIPAAAARLSSPKSGAGGASL